MRSNAMPITVLVAALALSPAWAQAQTTPTDPHAGHAPAAVSPASAPPAAEAPSTPPAEPAMDHGSMQGGAPPPDARDPHAYSGGYQRGTGRYAVAEGSRLRMADEHSFGTFLADRFEWVRTDDDTFAVYDVLAWYGRDYDRLWFKADGEVNGGELEEARTELLWGRAIAAYWDAQLGVRYDSGEGPNRGWLAFGVQGLAPYWFDLEATAYVGDEGRTALRLEAEYELLITQQLILQPRLEASFYGREDAERERGTGLSTVEAGVRLRYEILREFAPYIGIDRVAKYGRTADFARAAGEDDEETRVVAGVRFWF